MDSLLYSCADLLQVLGLPAWPAASTLLLRCINTLGGPKGLQHSDSSVKQISVDLLGLITAQLHKLVLLAESQQDWLAQLSSPGMSPEHHCNGNTIHHQVPDRQACKGGCSKNQESMCRGRCVVILENYCIQVGTVCRVSRHHVSCLNIHARKEWRQLVT